MNETIEEKVGEIFSKAYRNNELYEYLVGIGDYKIVFKDSANYDYNDIGLMQRGINSFLSKNPHLNLDDFLNRSLLDCLNSNDIFKVNAVLDFVLFYVKYIKRETVNFNINFEVIIPLLKDKILLLKQAMMEIKGKNDINGNLWQSVQNRCDLYEIRTGQKIL